ncbi:electron transfer flavoprotein subunit beta/FixA family protein [Salinarchaeum sp. IM2453]|uniref:electron transfer flavoprotein subunit beta/FixA family protein n=1 Tax=Salinarchaeum sp. IM2453 TaxID=2862870 RepID=UPI001C82A996|nr:electron transfer flavoprotein subunit beta/FixA family protein [Salinarchaeum sp. IM2453]QZA88005.1 electron transfer flavoprotein subunit beta/FixA family protein [Salinarchaeum sp. IM2453]
MKILVTVREVATIPDEFEIQGTQVDDRYLEYELNEWDDYAVEEAVQISEERDDVEVVTVTIGPERSEETIRMALAKGADRGIRIWDEALADQQLLDVEAKTRILAAVAKQEDPDLILTGVQAGDEAFGATGVALARRLDYGWAAVVNDLDLHEDLASVHRELEGGIEELTEVDLPSVLTIQTGINDPRYASLRGIRQAQRKELNVLSLSDLELSTDVADSRLEVTDMYVPDTGGEATVWEGSTEESTEKLAEYLHESGVIEA